MDLDAALAACRFLHDASAMLLFGSFGFLATLVPNDLAEGVGRRLAVFRMSVVAVAVITTAAILPLQAGNIGEGWSDAVNPATIRDVLFETSVGAAWQIQAIAALLLGATLLAPSAIKSVATAAAAGLLLATLALTGHAAMQEGWPGVAHRANDGFHVLAGGAWLGALVPLLPILRRLEEATDRTDAALALRRFSTFGHGAVALVIVSGMINTILVVGGLPTDWTFPYQALLAAKIAVVASMTLVAIANRYLFVPWLGRRRGDALEAIRLGTVAEIALGVVAVALVAWFGVMAPN